MASANITQFTDANFKTEVLDAPVPVLVDFWAEWCVPCRMLSSTIDELADQFQGRVKVGKMDTESNLQVPVQFGIQAIPTVILFKGGQIRKKFVGLQQKGDLAAALDEALKA